MNFGKAVIVLVISILLFAAACGGEKKAENLTSSARYLPEKFTQLASVRAGEIETYVGDSLYEYINGGAELYHLYNFVEVSTSIYNYGNAEIVLDVYQFDSPVNAFGLYSMMRPDEPAVVNLGVEGFSSGSSLDFVKAEYMVRLTGYDESATTIEGVRKMAAEMDKAVSGETNLPEMFTLFPTENIKAASAKYVAEAFMAHGFLTRVYTQDYVIGADTFTLFLIPDEAGEKYLQWAEIAERSAPGDVLPKNLPFEPDMAFALPSDFYGEIVAGLKNGKLMGIIDLTDGNREFFGNWLKTIQ